MGNVGFILLFLAGFLVLFRSAGILVTGASRLAKRLNVSDLVIGLTVVAFGTSLPELFVNLTASVKGSADLAIGNILGSNIANILLILGISAVIFPLYVTKGAVRKEIPLNLLAAVIIFIMANDGFFDKSGFSGLSRMDGMFLIAFFLIFIYYAFAIAENAPVREGRSEEKEKKIFIDIKRIVLGFLGLWIGSKLVVEGAKNIAEIFSLSQTFIGLTVVAIGTALPEMATSIVAAYRKNPGIAVGNVVGSNIFNLFFIFGISAVIKPVLFPPKINPDIGVVIFASALLCITMFVGRRRTVGRWEGAAFLSLYGGYVTFLFFRG